MPDSEVARKCPDCGALVAETLIGPSKGMLTLHCAECGHVTPSDLWVFGTWSPTVETSDSTELGGDVVGGEDADPYERNTVVLDTRRSVLLDHTDVAMMENGSDGRRFATALLQGRVNRSKQRSKVLYLFGADGCAALVAELSSLAVREGGAFEAEFRQRLSERMGEMP